jgi:hypothetical protein
LFSNSIDCEILGQCEKSFKIVFKESMPIMLRTKII